jgi:murein DD-endopeptidase MepM/ murein hydrolase activator NlpD
LKKTHVFKKSWIKRFVFAAVLIIMLPIKPDDYQAITEDDVKRAERELEAAKQQAKQLDNKLNELNGSISDTESYINQVDGWISDVTLQIYNLNQEINAKQAEIDAKQTQINDTLANIDAVKTSIAQTEINLSDAQTTEANQYSSMKLRIQYMYENGDESFLDILFSSDSMIDFLNNAEYISEISKYDREKLIEYGENKDRITNLLANLETQKSELETQEARYETELGELEEQKSVLDSKKSEQEVLQASYTDLYNAKNNELSNLESQQSDTEYKKQLALKEVEEQEQLVEQARKEYAAWLAELARLNKDADAAVAAKLAEINVTGFTWPVPGFNRITSQFGMRMHPILGYEKLHDGTDISGAGINGTPILAAYSGTVVLAQSYWGYGNCVKIDHGGGVVTLYAHASAILVSVGQQVNAGDTIALVGSTGNSTGPHLHFSLIIKGEFVNPLDYVVVPR